MSLVACLFSPPEQAGRLLKKSHSRSSWQERYFVLKGSYLFYFPKRKNVLQAKRVQGVIPLESAKIETELPPSMAKGDPQKGKEGCVITITLHSSHAFSAMHPFYVLCAPNQEVQQAWINALWQAAIPRADLIQHLSRAGKLADVLASYATNVTENFPVADASVLSSGGRARTAALANVGSLAGMIRRHKTAPAVKDIEHLPVVMSDRLAASHVLARTESGNVVTAPATAVMPAASFTSGARLNGGEASSAAASGASPRSAASGNATQAGKPSSSAPTTSMPASSTKPQSQPAAVALSVAAGTSATVVAANRRAGDSGGAVAGKAEELQAAQEHASKDTGKGKAIA